MSKNKKNKIKKKTWPREKGRLSAACSKVPEEIPRIGLTDWAKVKDKVALCFYGDSQEDLNVLILLRAEMEQEFPGLELDIICTNVDIWPKEPTGIVNELNEKEYGYVYF